MLRSSNINNGYLEFDDNVFVDTTSLKFYPVEEGDILICVRNGSKSLIGKNALITEKAEGMAFGALWLSIEVSIISFLLTYSILIYTKVKSIGT